MEMLYVNWVFRLGGVDDQGAVILTDIPVILTLHADITAGFLHGEIPEDLYMCQPEGDDSGNADLVYKLRKFLYGLKQASRQWYAKLCEKMAEIGFRPSDADAGLFTRKISNGLEAFLVHVDDMLIACGTGYAAGILWQLQFFTLTDSDEASFFLRMEIVRNRERKTITLSQRRYSTDVLDGMTECKPKPQSFSMGTKVSKTVGTPL
eukprot:332137-Chlamydomonas_euryale.AAC.2